MQIFTRVIDGRTITLQVTGDQTIQDVKNLIEGREGVLCDQQRLTYAGRTLEDYQLIAGCGIEEESTLDLTLNLLGGAKKRKKKNYTTPKKNKHKKKKVKLAVLKYYRVDENGKITRLRRECPYEAGVFMANHFDRQYCGKCGATFVFTQEQQQEKAKSAKGGKKK
ncbi:Ubiquitin-40S ribosomal protein S27a [Trichoplax sp. H2]|uniref:Ubiquitin-like domain-containing protein n=1 Tax=Trichoplax adhaerens TaxID=10228 RepID=B3RJY2_TRIAD|nr:expressed hypothetical protein [Trichoplax adhaerens]EDV29863.1 expressed hypothetical protein [Trichoplax adhaerens]RDD42980.1 Ubiquitin-40S ribosomal protein S27a [Trichoplax sp. H2]|eukprot:XP_002109065.1 expressed hypothetical protein [Trichoplax adhaerens]